MSDLIDKHISEKNFENAIKECINSNKLFLSLYLGKLLLEPNHPLLVDIEEKINTYKQKIIRVKLLCNWCSSEQLANIWNKMSQGNFTWNNLELVWDDNPDYYVIINKPPPDVNFDKKRTIVFQMEPNMSENTKQWGEWADPKQEDFLKVCKHNEDEYNNNEWHLSLTYNQLCDSSISKNEEYNNVISVVLSGKYYDPGHIKRVDFVKFLESKNFPVHVFGDNRWDYQDYKGGLPYHCKDNGILPYKYVFNAENHPIPYYYTEKLIDGILGECLTFYWGCPNIRELIDPRAYVQLELSNFENDYKIIQKAIEEDWYSKKLPYIKEAKRKILNQLQFFPRIEKIINSHNTI